MLSTLTNLVNKAVGFQQEFVVHVPLLGLGRSVLACSLLLTLLFTNPYVMFSSLPHDSSINNDFFFAKYNFFSLFGASHINLARWLACLLLLVVISGYLPQITCMLHWYLAYSFNNATLDIEGGDQVCLNMAMLLIPICLLDRRLNHWSKPISDAHKWQRYTSLFCSTWFWLIRLQLAVIYLHAAIGKMVEKEWINGTALYYWFNHPLFGMQSWLKPIVEPIIMNQHGGFILTWFIMLLELLLGVAIIQSPKHYKKFFIVALIFHFFIILFHGLFSFFISMSGALVLAFLIPYYNFKINKQPVNVLPNQ